MTNKQSYPENSDQGSVSYISPAQDCRTRCHHLLSTIPSGGKLGRIWQRWSACTPRRPWNSLSTQPSLVLDALPAAVGQRKPSSQILLLSGGLRTGQR